MSALSDRLQQYLDHRRQFGHNLASTAEVLRTFVKFATLSGAEWITTALFLSWQQRSKATSPATWSARLSLVRGFAIWLHAIDPRTEVPPAGLVRRPRQRPRPYIYTEEEIAGIVACAAQLRSPGGLRGSTLSTLFGLIAVTGMRLSEALGLDDRDVDLEQAVLLVRRGKGGRFRMLPIASSTAKQLGTYREARSRLPGDGGAAFFVNDSGRRLSTTSAQAAFAQVGAMVGFRKAQPDGKRGYGPRIHDLRHAMAVHTLIDWYRQGLDPNQEMIKLTTYLGHEKPAYTYWYIEAVPELMQLACERADQALGEGGGT